MMATEEVMPKSGDTSQDSRDSGGGSQKGMLELLSITEAAVKALNKSTHSASSHGSQGSRGSKTSQQPDPLAQPLNSDRSEKSAHSGRSGGSLHSGRSLASGASVRSHVSEVSVKSRTSVVSGTSQQSARSALSQHSAFSQGSLHSAGSLKTSQLVHETSHDSGLNSKTHTVSEKSKPRGTTLPVSLGDDGIHEHSSDESTTASDVLIKSTLEKSLMDKSGHSVAAQGQGLAGSNGHSSSASSKCSKISYGAENFNSSGPQKVKISKKHLREIKPPFDDDSPRTSVSSDGKVPSALLSARSNSSGRQTGTQSSKTNGRNMHGKEEVISSNDSNGERAIAAAKPVPRGTNSDYHEPFKVDKVRKSAEKPYEDVNMAKPQSKTNSANFDKKSQSSTGSSRSGGQIAAANLKSQGPTAIPSLVDHTDIQFRSTPKYRVERHTPQKAQSKTGDKPVSGVVHVPEKKNLLQDLEDSMEIITAHARDSSNSSSQPEIVTIPERIVTVSAQNSASPSSVLSDPAVPMTTPPLETFHSAAHRLRDDRGSREEQKGSLDDSNLIPPALTRPLFGADDNNNADKNSGEESRPLPARFQWFSRQATGKGLQQGGIVNGHEAPDTKKDEDIHISDFKMTDKQKIAKEAFARRQGGPVRRVVQPRIVGHDSKASSTSSTGELKPRQPDLGQSNDQVLTCAAAASAAVAATQPFLKAQQDMEMRMAEVLAKIAELQGGKTTATATGVESERVRQLEKQLADMTDRRIDYMERLQEQQLAMQAKLLSMTRDSGSVSRPYHPRSYSPDNSLAPQNKAFTKTTVAWQPTKGDYTRQTVLDPDESSSPLDTPAPRARAPRPTINTSDIVIRAARGRSPKARSRSPKTKSPKARSSPKAKSRSPVRDLGILHQILSSDVSPTRDIPGGSRPAIQTRSMDVCESPNVRKARTLIEDLSHIKDQVKGLVEDKENWKSGKDVTGQQQHESSVLSHDGPSPLDSYLKMPAPTASSPSKGIADMSSSHYNAPVLPGFKDAENILRQVQQNRGFLESNFESVMRARQEVEVYSMLESVYNDSTDHEKARIKKMVDKSIQKLRREVEREVTDDLVISELKKKSSATVPGAVKMPEPTPAPKQGTRYGIRGRLQQPKAEPKVEPKKPTVAKRPGMGVPSKDSVHQRLSRPPGKKTKSVFANEEMMTRVYGKASYQKGRTTVKDPYLHFQNTTKHKAPRPATAPDMKGTEMMSSKTQTGDGSVKQFYFNPATGTYIHVASTATAPIPGQLIPMAVPLGGPRMDPGLTVNSAMSSAPGHMTFDPVSQVTADGNVAMVTMGMQDDRKSGPVPELGKQVLPPVDIDTDLSDISESIEDEPMPDLQPTTPERKPKKHVQIMSPRGSPNKTPGRSPGKPHYEVVYHQDSDNAEEQMMDQEIEKGESNGSSDTVSQPAISHSIHTHLTYNSDDTLPEDEDDVETAPGLQFPGYQSQEEPGTQHNGPAFPPKLPSADRQLTSDLIAEDIRRRDLLQNNAMEWLEQELMARVITEMYPLKEAEDPPGDISHVVSEVSEDSMAEEKEKSMFVIDTIGHRGMQLFVDTGVPVDNSLVNQLVSEVLQEKIRSMLGQRPDQEAGTSHKVPPRGGAESPDWEEPVSEEIEQPEPRAQVITPEPTPRATPRSSPPRHISPARTPLASPPPGSPRRAPDIEPEVISPVVPQPVMVPYVPPVIEPDSEPESSASYDIREELDRLADKLRPVVDTAASIRSRHDIATPPESPKPVPEEPARPLTPPQLSPREVKEQFTISQSIVPAGTSQDRTPSRPSKMESPKSATSPQVTDLAEEELAEDQPKPVVFTVAETQTEKVELDQPKPRSPSPAKSHSRTPSESSYTESSSISDTFNECVSEGQWLINRSDGEMADFPINEVVVRDRMLRQSGKRVDVSSASTWKDLDDVDLEDMNENSKSEGEFMYKADFPPEKDPVLDLVARLQSAGPQYGLYNMSNRQVSDVLNTTGKSEGEVIRVSAPQQYRQPPQYDTRQQQHDRQQYERLSEGQFYPERDTNRNNPQRSKSPKPSKSHRTRSPHGESYQDRTGKGSPHKRVQSPSHRAPSPTRVSFEGDLNDQRPSSPTRGILKRSSTFEGQGQSVRSRDEVPVRDTGRSPTPTGRLTPGGRAPQGMMMAGGRAGSPGKSMRKPPQVNKSSTMPEMRGSGARLVNVRTSGEERDSLENSAGPRFYGSDQGTRTMTPDQMNIDALIQSGGYLSQSFSQSEAAGRQTGQSSLRSSAEMRASRTSGNGQSLGYSYGTEGSMSYSELQRLAAGGSGKLQMSLTLPTGQEESDLSEIDITDGNTR